MSPLRRVEVGLAHVFQPGEEAEEAGQAPFPEGVLTCPACGSDSLHLLRVEVHQDPTPEGAPGSASGARATALRMGCGGGHRFSWHLAVLEGLLVASLEDVVEADA
jgi:hypothetical protein